MVPVFLLLISFSATTAIKCHSQAIFNKAVLDSITEEIPGRMPELFYKTQDEKIECAGVNDSCVTIATADEGPWNITIRGCTSRCKPDGNGPLEATCCYTDYCNGPQESSAQELFSTGITLLLTVYISQ